MTGLLLTFLVIIIMCCYTVIKETIQKSMKEKENDMSEKKISKKPIIISGVIGIIVIIVICICLSNLVSNSNNKSEWDNLSDEEKEWYKDNYGNGKLEDINKAIDEYKENH
ncbi:MAG: hypothetical protein ACI4S2_03690 [Lachnospiraceae bacterium]